MRFKHGKLALAGIGVALVVPTIALASYPRGGTFTSATADVHVARGGTKIVNADINCKLQGGVTVDAIDFNAPIKIKRSGSFAYSGTAEFLHFTGSGYKSHSTTASLKGRFTTSKHVRGTVSGGPGACSSATFAATYNPRAR